MNRGGITIQVTGAVSYSNPNVFAPSAGGVPGLLSGATWACGLAASSVPMALPNGLFPVRAAVIAAVVL